MTPGAQRDPNDVIAALERLVAKDVLTMDQARLAARIITGDESLEFPPPPDKAPAESASAAAGEVAAPQEGSERL